MRQLAWLHAVPDTKKGSPKERSRSRYEWLKGTPEADLPELEWGKHLIGALLEFGPAMNGPTAATFSEIESWARVTRTHLPGYEALILRKLSREYCSEYYAASDPTRPAPLVEEEGRVVADGFANLIKRFR